jgi:hypothetical protein
MRGLFVALVVMLASASLLAAQVVEPGTDGTALLPKCRAMALVLDGVRVGDATELIDASYCLGLVQGIRDTQEFAVRSLSAQPAFCAPSTVRNGDLVRAVVAYLDANPDKLRLGQSTGVILALREAYPCDSR